MIHVTDAIETGYQYTDYEFSYGGGSVKITGLKYDDRLEGSFSANLYKDNSSSLLRPNDKYGSMYADTDPVSGTLKNDAGSAFSIFFN